MAKIAEMLFYERMTGEAKKQQNILDEILPSSSPFLPTHEEDPSLPHAYEQCPHNS